MSEQATTSKVLRTQRV